MRYAFSCRETTVRTVWVEAEHELGAWEEALTPGAHFAEASDAELLRDPVLRREPKLDEYDL